MSEVYTCHAPGCSVTNAQDETLEDYFHCEIHAGTVKE